MPENNLRRFERKTALVTGATSGIGNAISRRLLAEGANVAVAGRRIELLQGLQKQYGSSVLVLRTDVMIEADVQRLVQGTADHFGSLDLAFNVAGAARIGTIVEGSSKDWEETINLCLRSVYWCIKYEAKQFVAQKGGGVIVNVSSLNQVVPFYGASSYATAKAGLGMLTQNAALELARHKIRVNALLPGLTETPATEIISSSPKIYDLYMERIPFGRAAHVDEVAGPAVFLATADASYVTGASLIVDGGWATTGYPDSSRWLSDWLPPA